MGVFLSYVSARGHTLIDRELYLPFDWLEDRDRGLAAGIPETVRCQSKPEQAVQMLERVFQAHIPISWVVADPVYGGNLDLRTWLEGHQYPYVLAVACDEPVGIMTPGGQRRRVEAREVEALVLHERDWQRLSMSEGTKGPRLFDWARVPVLHRWEDDGCHWLLMRRSLTDMQEKRYYLVFDPQGSTLQEMVQAVGARWHIEEDFANAKDMGLDHYEVRSFVGWYRHITLVLLALAYLAGICVTASGSPAAAPSQLSSPSPVLVLTIVSRAPSPCPADLARFFIGTPGVSLVMVASPSPTSCELLPYETSSENWLILARFPFSTHVCGPVDLFSDFPDFPELSWKSRSSGTFP